MVMTDVIGDTLTRIRNAQSSKLVKTRVIYSKVCLNLLDILYKEGYIYNYCVKKSSKDNFNYIEVKLKYYKDKPVISKLERISKPGRRVYLSLKELNALNPPYGIYIISTSKGLVSFKRKVSDSQILEINTGGEVLCRVY